MGSETCAALTSLIRWNASLDGLIEDANRCDRHDGPPVCLNRTVVRDVLQRCVAGELNIVELPKWSGAVHMLDRLEFDEPDVDLLTQFLFEVSTPELFEPVTVDVCRRWIDRLAQA